MRKLLNSLLIEWKLLFRGFSFWLLLAMIVGLFYATTLNSFRIDDLGWYVSGLLYLYFSPLFLIAQFLSVAAARREITTRTYPILQTLPFHSAQVIGARLLALVVPFSLFAVIPALFYWLRGTAQGLNMTSLSTGIGVLLTYIVPTLLTIVLSYWIGTWSRKRISYLLSFALTLCLIVLARIIFAPFISAHWLHLFDMGLTDLYTFNFYSQLWGFVIDRTFWLHRLLYIGLIFLLFGGIVASNMKQRSEKQGRITLAACIGIATLVCLFTIFNYALLWQERTASFQEQIAFYQQAPDRLLTEQDASLRALSYDLEVRTGHHHELKVEAEFQLTHDSLEPFERFPLSLRHTFTVGMVEVNGRAVGYEWEPYTDVLWIEATDIPAGEILTINMSYSGQVDEWFLRKGSRTIDDHWERRVFVDDDKLFLPAYYGWYPLPGHHQLAEYEAVEFMMSNESIRTSHEISENMMPHQPADFNIKVTAPSQMNIVSNGTQLNKSEEEGRQHVAFSAENSDGFTLIGGDITRWTSEEDEKSVSLILSNQISEAKAEQLLEDFHTHYTILRDIIKLIDANIPFSPQMTFIRAEYPGNVVYDFDEPFMTLAITEDVAVNNTQFLPGAVSLSNFAQYSHRWFNEHTLQQTIYPLDQHAGGYRYWDFESILTKYIERTLHPTDGPLFDPWDHRVSGKPSPLYLAVNDLYERTGHDQFRDMIAEIYHFMRQYYEDHDSFDAAWNVREALTDYIHSFAGDDI